MRSTEREGGHRQVAHTASKRRPRPPCCGEESGRSAQSLAFYAPSFRQSVPAGRGRPGSIPSVLQRASLVGDTRSPVWTPSESPQQRAFPFPAAVARDGITTSTTNRSDVLWAVRADWPSEGESGREATGGMDRATPPKEPWIHPGSSGSGAPGPTVPKKKRNGQVSPVSFLVRLESTASNGGRRAVALPPY